MNTNVDDTLPPALRRKNDALDEQLKSGGAAPAPTPEQLVIEAPVIPAAPSVIEPVVTAPTPTPAPTQQIVPQQPSPGVSPDLARLETENQTLRRDLAIAEQRFRTSEGRYESQHGQVKAENEQLRLQMTANETAVESMRNELAQLRQQTKVSYTDFLDADTKEEFGNDTFTPDAMQKYIAAMTGQKDDEIIELRKTVDAMRENFASMDNQVNAIKGDVTTVIPDWNDVNNGLGEWAFCGGWGTWLGPEEPPSERRSAVTAAFQNGDWYTVSAYVNQFKSDKAGESATAQLQNQIVPEYQGSNGSSVPSQPSATQQDNPVYTSQRFDEFRRKSRDHSWANSEECRLEEQAQKEAMQAGTFEPMFSPA